MAEANSVEMASLPPQFDCSKSTEALERSGNCSDVVAPELCCVIKNALCPLLPDLWKLLWDPEGVSCDTHGKTALVWCHNKTVWYSTCKVVGCTYCLMII